MKYLWEAKNWPKLTWRDESLLPLVGQARKVQGMLFARVKNLGFELGELAQADILTEEAIKTSAIEGERLNPEAVRSSVAKHLGLPTAGLTTATRSVDGLIEVLLDATQNYAKPLTASCLKRWQAALFPTGQSGLRRIRTGKWRGDNYTVSVVSGSIGREKVHFESPPGKRVDKEMQQFLSWWNQSLGKVDGLLRSGVAHLHFVTIHPFDDGNGRVARALTDMALAQDDQIPTRYYSLSSQIMQERKDYYIALEATQKEELDITKWLKWYLGCYTRALQKAETLIADVFLRSAFWQKHSQVAMNERQRKVVNRLVMAGKGKFLGGLTTRKYIAMTKTSRATAFREISDLVDKGILNPNPAQGRSANYDLSW